MICKSRMVADGWLDRRYSGILWNEKAGQKPAMTDRKIRKDRTDRPAWPGTACRFLDFALRAALEMTRRWTFRFLDSDSRLRLKSQEAPSHEMSRAMLSGPMLFQSILFFYFSLSFCSAIVSSTICCNWYVATPNGLLIPLRDHSTMVLLWERHISRPMLGLSSSPLRSSSAALT